MSALEVAPGVTIPEGELRMNAVRGSGPGGQNVNKVASKVELRFDLPGTAALRPEVKARLQQQARNRLDAEGWILLTSQKTRDQAKNLDDAREKLRQLILEAMKEPTPRFKTRPSRGSVERRLREKRSTATRKQERSRRDD